MDQLPVQPTSLRIAAVQLAITSDIAINADGIVERIRNLRDHNLLVFPEYALSGRLHLTSFAQQADWASQVSLGISRIQEATTGLDGLVVVPSMLPATGGRWTNSAVWLQRGNIIAHHHKSLLTPAEKEWCDPGNVPHVITLDGVTYGLTLCLEGNGSETIGRLVMAGATVILQPSFPDGVAPSWPKGDVDPWHVDIRALFPLRHRIRALIDQVNIIWVAPAHAGSITRIFSSTGDVVAEAPDERPAVVTAELDLTHFAFRNSPTFRRRQELNDGK